MENNKGQIHEKIYTGRGDDGTAGLLSGERLPKSHERIDAVGDLDEITSALGVLRASMKKKHPDLDMELRRIQTVLFMAASWISVWRESPMLDKFKGIDDEQIRFLEEAIDRIDGQLPVLKNFILPNGHPLSAWTHFARTVCRRAERHVVRLSIEMKVGRPPRQIRGVMIYLNRLSDYLFVLGRYYNHIYKEPDDLWQT